MAKILCSTLLFIFSFSIVFAQSNPVEKKIEKVYALLKKDKIDKAEEELVVILDNYAYYGKGWDLLAKIRLYKYNESKNAPNLFGENITVTTTDKDGNKVESENDSLGNSLMELFAKMDPSKTAYDKWLYTLRKATLLSNTAYDCSIKLRNELRAVEVDTLVGMKALKYYKKAETEFGNKNYNKAAGYYKKAVEMQPDFYKAQLYLADAYYFLGDYNEAIKHFKSCSDKFPTFLEPRKYLVDSYVKLGLDDEAMLESINAMMVYPDPVVYARYENILYGKGQEFDIEWRPRPIFPNTIDRDTSRFELVNKEESELKELKDPWKYYKEAMSKIEEYCDERGIVAQSNSLTSSRYLEVYSWEEMLKNSKSDELSKVREIQEKGYLDCYVLVTCFHDDIYDQYLHFVTNNKEKVLTYFQHIAVK